MNRARRSMLTTTIDVVRPMPTVGDGITWLLFAVDVRISGWRAEDTGAAWECNEAGFDACLEQPFPLTEDEQEHAERVFADSFEDDRDAAIDAQADARREHDECR